MVSPHARVINLFGDDDNKTFKTSPLEFSQPEVYQSVDLLTPEQKIISHNNFNEFGSGKSAPIEQSQSFNVDPWTLSIDGLVKKNLILNYDDLYKTFDLQERIYRLRCVEA